MHQSHSMKTYSHDLHIISGTLLYLKQTPH